MKQNNNDSPIRHSFLALFLLFSLLFWFTRNGFPNWENARLVTFDTKNIAEMFVGMRELSDWHSALFAYEGIGLAKLWSVFIPDGEKSRFGALFIFWVISMTVTYTCLCVLLNKWMKTHFLYALCGVPIAILFGLKFNHIGLDTFFVSIILLLSIVISHVREKKQVGKIYKVIVSGVIILLVLHMVSYRRNSLLLVPLIFYYFLPVLHVNMQRKYLRIFSSIILTIVCCIISGPIVKHIFPTFNSHPVTPMMASDMRIAITLRGEEYTSDNPYIQGNSLGHLTPGIERGSFTRSQAGTEQAREDESWALFVKRYKEEWMQHPGDMLMSRFIQACEFYTGANLPSGIIRFTEFLYPAIKKNPNAWNMPRNKEGKLLWQPICASHMIRNYIVLLPAILAAFLYIWFSNSKLFTLTGSKENAFLLGISGLYALSYLVVTPTWDQRYLMPSILMASLVIFPMGISLILIVVQKIKQKDF